MRVVVTGGAGFIGGNLCRELIRRQITPVVLDDLSTGRLENLAGTGIEVCVGSVLDADLVAQVCAGADSIVHLAALASVPGSVADPLRSHHINATGTLNVCEAARAAGAHLVVASSSAVYGRNPAPSKLEDMPVLPASPYAASKVATEAYVQAYQESYGLSAAIFRFFNVYGPGQPADHVYAAVVPAFINAALRGRPVTVYGDGEQSRDFAYVETVAEVLAISAIEQRRSPGPVNLACGVSISINDLLVLLSAILALPIEVVREAERVGDVRHSQADVAALRTMFPHLRQVSLVEALRTTVAWMRSEIAVTEGQAVA